MFRINGLSWRIYLVSSNHPILLTPSGNFSIGVCDKKTQKIYINENLENLEFKKVLCHEIVHAAMLSYGVILTDVEEELVADLIASYGEEIIEITNSVFSKMKNRGLT